MLHAALVFLGGGIGSVLRYQTGMLVLRHWGGAFPYGTLAVNLIGCFVMGVLFRFLPSMEAGGQSWRLLLLTGVLGGFTTFSAFSLDAAQLWMRGEVTSAVVYVLASVVFSLLGVSLGLWIAR